MSLGIQLPDEAMTLIVFGSAEEYRGQATYWKRNGQWEMIGVTKSMKWLHEVDFENVKRSLKKRGLTFEWRKSLPFTKERLNKKGKSYGWVT